MTQLKNTSPGDILRTEFMEPLDITQYRLAQAIGVQQTRISEILSGKRSISADTAIRLGRYLGTTPLFWLNLQAHYDLAEADAAGAGQYDAIVPHEAVAEGVAELETELNRAESAAQPANGATHLAHAKTCIT